MKDNLYKGKIIHVLNNFLPHKIAGTEVYVWSLSKDLIQQGWEVKVLTPLFGKNNGDEYIYDGIRVIRYPENSGETRDLILGNDYPKGIFEFEKIIKNELPDIIHFHETSAGSGIGIRHIEIAKSYCKKSIMTFHVSKYTCKTSTLMKYGSVKCNGKIDITTCGTCYLRTQKLGLFARLLTYISFLLDNFGINLLKYSSKITTALSTVAIIRKQKLDLLSIFNLVDKIIVLTNWNERVLIINGVDPNKLVKIKQALPYQAIKNKIKIDNDENKQDVDKIKLIYFGRIVPEKGLHLLINAISSINSDKFQLSIYGLCDENNYCLNLKMKTRKNKNIFWKGEINQNDVLSIMQNHHLLCLCSTVCEMSPLVIQEAFEARIPVLASDVLGNAEQIIHNVNGLLFDYNDTNSLINQLKRILREDELLSELKSNLPYPEKFNMIGKAYSNVYQELLDSH